MAHTSARKECSCVPPPDKAWASTFNTELQLGTSDQQARKAADSAAAQVDQATSPTSGLGVPLTKAEQLTTH